MRGDETPTRVAPAASLHLACLDQLRAAAALYVALFHALLVLWPIGGPNPPAYLAWAWYGHFGVTVFIVLSGFSLALGPAMRGSTSVGSYSTFMQRRGRRMLPPYWVALAGSVLLLALAPGNVSRGSSGGAGGEWTGKGPVPASSVLVFGFLLQDFIEARSPNSPFWSIAVEWHLYFLFPLLLLAIRKFGLIPTVTGATIIGLFIRALVEGKWAMWAMPHFLGLFAMGAATAYGVAAFRRTGHLPGWIPRVDGWWFLISAFGAFVALADHWEPIADIVAGPFIMLSIYLMACRTIDEESRGVNRVRGPLASALLWVGALSYSLYLVHSPTQKIVWHFVVSRLDLPSAAAWVVLFALSTPVAIFAAWVLYRLVERPAHAWSRKLRNPPAAAAGS